MTKTMHAIVHNGTLDLEEQLNLPEGERVTIIITTEASQKSQRKSFFERAAELDIEAPSDFSKNIDEYLYRGKKID